MSSLKELFCLVLLCVSVLPVLPQQCDQFTIQPPVGPGMPLVIPEGGGATLTCRHSTRPPFTVNWFRDVTTIRPDNADTLDECGCQVLGVDPLNENIMDRVLMFMNFDQEFAGEYSCRAPRNTTAGTFDICRFSVLAAEAPSIQELPPKNRTVSIDDTLTIPVRVAGVPTPTISWRNSSTDLVNSSRVVISDTGSLTVTGVKSYDRGNYSLNLTNVGGDLVRHFSVFVPFVDIRSISEPDVGPDQISVTCIVVGYPNPSVEWQDPSSNVVNSNIRTIVSPDTYETTIRATITLNRNCQGQYSCSARNTDQNSRITTTVSDDFCERVPDPPPRPTGVVVMQNGQNSVRISWTIEDSNLDFMFEVCYTQAGQSEVCPGSELPKTTTEYSITSGLLVGVNYTFLVYSRTNVDRIKSDGRSLTLSPCLGEVSVQVYGISVNTTVNEGERTFNISWREVQDDSGVFGYKVEETKGGWTSVVSQRVVTNFVTPANFCNGEDHSFVVMAINNCGLHGPPSTPVIGKCESPGRIKITSVTPSSTFINVTWALKASASSYSIRPPLSITVLEIQMDSNGQQLQFNYSTDRLTAECLGGLKPSTIYEVCLHPVYSDGLTEIMPMCVYATTKSSDGDGVAGDNCRKPENTTKQGTPVEQALLPDYAIAVIVIGIVILLAVIVCGIGVCFACSNNKNKDIDDIGSEYSSSIAAGMGMQGRMSSNHNRNMSPTRSCLSYHTKGHSTNWQDHMGTLREMETEVGTNV